MIPENTNLKEGGLQLLPNQFEEQEVFTTYLGEYLGRVDQNNTDAFYIADNFSIDLATGVYLDYIGTSVGLARSDGESDTEYRRRISSQVLVNNSQGTVNDLLGILSDRTLTDNVRMWSHYPLCGYLYTDGSYVNQNLVDTLQKAAPITTEKLRLIWDSTGNAFRGSERVASFGELVADNLDEIVDINIDDVVVKTMSYSQGDRSKLSEFMREAFTLETNTGDDVVDENGNEILIYLGGQSIQTDGGVLAELLEAS